MPAPQKLFEDDSKLLSSVLSDKEIKDYIDRDLLISRSTFNSSSLEASSYDIRVGAKGIIGGEGIEINLTEEGVMVIPPGAYAGVVSHEKMNFPKNIFARLGAKRALSYEGIILLTGSIVDPGYIGHLLFGLYNASQRKVHIRPGRKICNIVFEKLSIEPEKNAQPEPNLLYGNFPDAFLDKISNMDVLPWAQISERVKQIENITKELFDLRAKYEDVLKPIKELTDNVRSLSQTVHSISEQTKALGIDLDKSNTLINENGRQIAELTNSMRLFSDRQEKSETKLSDINITVKSQKLWTQILGAIFLLVIGAVLAWLLSLIKWQ